MRFEGNTTLLFLFALYSCQSVVAAIAGPIFSFPSCSICPVEGESPTNVDLILPVNTAGILVKDTTCGQAETNAMEGDYSPFACTILQQEIAEDCGCPSSGTGTTPTTPAPVAAPTKTPVMVPVAGTTGTPVAVPVGSSTGTPVMVPVKLPTGAPVMVPAPTETPVMVPVVVSTEAPVTAPVVVPVAVGTPTESPVIVPTPVMVVTDMPVMVPVTDMPVMVPVTDMPSMVPVTESPVVYTTAPVLNATVGVTLEGVDLPDGMTTLSTEMEGTVIGKTEEYLASKLPCATNITCTIEYPTTTTTTRRQRRQLRSLQTKSISFDFLCNGVTEDLEVDEFAAEMVAYLNNPEFVTDLNGTPGFEGVTTLLAVSGGIGVITLSPVEAPIATPTEAPVVPETATPTSAAKAPVVPPVVAPTKSPTGNATSTATTGDDDDLSSGAVVGIVIGVLLAVAAIGICLYCCNKSTPPPAPVPVVAAAPAGRSVEPIAEVSKIKTDMVNPPKAFEATKIDKPPVASAAAVAAAASGSFVDPSVIKSGSVIGAEAGASDTSTAAGDTVASGAMSSLKQSMLCREVEAPPGKLGIVIDTTLEGPVVHKISADSPLEGVVFPGDIIVAINDVDTRAMSASAITALMARTSTSRRVLTVLSEDVSK